MLIKGRPIDEKKIVSNTVYVIYKKREIEYIEPQPNDNGDKIIVSFNLQKTQYGVFVKEYRPGFINKDNCKKADILILVVDEYEKEFSSWIFDIKVSIGGEDVIFGLLEQLCDSYKHKNSMTAYFAEFEEKQHLGFITRDYQKERIKRAIQSREEYILNEKEKVQQMSSTTKFSVLRQILQKEQEIKVLKLFLDGYIEINNVLIPLEYYLSKNDGCENVCKFEVAI